MCVASSHDMMKLLSEKEECMKLSHRFLLEFFGDRGFYELGVNQHQKRDEGYKSKWFSNVNWKGEQLWVSKLQLYAYFKSWKTAKGHNGPMSSKTFEKQLADIGLCKSRIEIRGGCRKMGFKVNIRAAAKAVSELYKFDVNSMLEDEISGELEGMLKEGGLLKCLQDEKWYY